MNNFFRSLVLLVVSLFPVAPGLESAAALASERDEVARERIATARQPKARSRTLRRKPSPAA